jgi:hypothetical protein
LQPAATTDISADPGGTCEQACFHVESSKDIGFIAVDSVSCGEAPVAWSLFAVGEDGTEAPLDVAPEPYGPGKACPGVPLGALKYDDLDGRHFVVCAAGARDVDIYVKSGKTCSSKSFEMTPPMLELQAAMDPQGCKLTTFYETWDVTRADSTPLPVGSYTCHWTFDDGGTSDACAGNYTFSAPGFHTARVTVTETASGATGSDTIAPRPIWDELAVQIEAVAPACGLSFSYTITKTGGKPSGGINYLSISPHENVLTSPEPGTNGGTIEVSAPGTYVVRAYRDEETSFSLCTASDTTEVTVSACP